MKPKSTKNPQSGGQTLLAKQLFIHGAAFYLSHVLIGIHDQIVDLLVHKLGSYRVLVFRYSPARFGNSASLGMGNP